MPLKTALLVCVSALFVTGAARAGERGDCASASERAQALRSDAHLRAAEHELLTCARPACPAVVRRDCDEWLTEVRRSLPTVVFGARDAEGHDLTAVRVLVDGVVLAERLDGVATAVDPGVHDFRFEAAGVVFNDERLLVREGEKERLVTARARPQPRVTPPPPATSIFVGAARRPDPSRTMGAGGESAATDPGTRRWPTGAFVAGGIGVAALGTFTVLAVDGQARFDRCRTGGGCAEDTLSALTRERVIAWSCLAVSVIAVGSALWIGLSR